MKNNLRWFVCILCFVIFVCFLGCSSASVDSSNETETDDSEENITLYGDDGTEIPLIALDEDTVGVYGSYTCDGDGSVWNFGGKNLAISFLDDGKLGGYVCDLTFYQTEPDEDGTFYLCVLIDEILMDTRTYWYMLNILDDDTTDVTGLILINPLNSEEYIQLTLEGSSDTESETETPEVDETKTAD